MLVAAVPYAWGLALWLAASLAAYLAAIRAILPRPETLLIAAAFPAVFVNIGHGQNGFLTAALLGGALQLLDRRPWLAGMLIGLLAYKPQFGVLIPIALLASQRWSTIAAAMATIAALVAISFATLGGRVWHAFIDSMTFTQTVVLEQGGTGWEKIQSIFSAARNWGADIRTAYAIQTRARRDARRHAGVAVAQRGRLRAEGLRACDRKPARHALRARLRPRRIAVAIAFFVRHGFARGFRDYEISLLAAAWIVPLLSRGVAGATGIPLGLIVMLALYGFTLKRALRDRENVKLPARVSRRRDVKSLAATRMIFRMFALR